MSKFRLQILAGRFADRIFSSRTPLSSQLVLRNRDDLRTDDIGAWSYGGLSVVRWSKNGKLKIGRFCSFAADTSILLGGEHRLDAVSTYPFGIFVGGVARDVHELTKGDVIIGNDVWVGNGAVILSGVTIGDGAVIGARSLVTRDVAPYSIVAGNPAKHIRMRFDEATVRSLLQIEWWNWSEEKIKAEAPHLASANMTEFMRRHAKTVLDPAE